MDFQLSDEQEAIRESVKTLCKEFPDPYWRKKDTEHAFPHEFFGACAAQGWLGICIPEEYGGSGLGIVEASIMNEAIASSGAAMAGVAAIQVNVFGLSPIVAFGNEQQKRRMLPPIAKGEVKACFAVTEPDAGLNTTQLKTKAQLVGDRYVVNGQKVWISTAQVADKMLLLARTTPVEEVTSRSRGLSLFYTDLDRQRITVREIQKMGRAAVDSNELFIENLEIPVDDLIGGEGRGFEYILHGMNAERILLAADAVGVGRAALDRATHYACNRIVFDRPIGKNQAVQHPLATNWIELEAAWAMTMQAAWMYDRQSKTAGPMANAAKYLAAKAAMNACQTAVMTHGGFGYAKEYDVERYLREIMIPWIAPVSPNMILCYIAERVLGLPKSY